MADEGRKTARYRSRNMKALVVVGHPVPGSFNHALADTIRQTWATLGCDVTFHDLAAIGFDPRMTATEAREAKTDDPLVRRYIDELCAADLLAVVHPNCWGAPPAIMKGWIDRVFAANAAYGFEKGTDQGDMPIGLLRTKAALVINTGNTPLDREVNHFHDPLDHIWRNCILGYCGVQNITRKLFGVIATSTDEDRRQWLAETANLATDAFNSAHVTQ
jgi:NAD(P)H dehydrogenase (quinone)